MAAKAAPPDSVADGAERIQIRKAIDAAFGRAGERSGRVLGAGAVVRRVHARKRSEHATQGRLGAIRARLIRCAGKACMWMSQAAVRMSRAVSCVERWRRRNILHTWPFVQRESEHRLVRFVTHLPYVPWALEPKELEFY